MTHILGELAQSPEYELLAVGGREELFERERESDPDINLWDDCARACDDLVAQEE